MDWSAIFDSPVKALEFIKEHETRVYGKWEEDSEPEIYDYENYTSGSTVPICISPKSWPYLMCHVSYKVFGCGSEDRQEGVVGKKVYLGYYHGRSLLKAIPESKNRKHLVKAWDYDGWGDYYSKRRPPPLYLWFHLVCADDGHEFETSCSVTDA